jgi:hypothetical protein
MSVIYIDQPNYMWGHLHDFVISLWDFGPIKLVKGRHYLLRHLLFNANTATSQAEFELAFSPITLNLSVKMKSIEYYITSNDVFIIITLWSEKLQY